MPTTTTSDHPADFETRLSLVEAKHAVVESELSIHLVDMRDFRIDTGNRLGRIETRLDTIDTRLDTMDTRLDTIDTRLDTMDTRLDTIDSRLDTIDGRLDTMDGRFDAIDGRLDVMDSRFDTMESRFNAVDGDMQKLRTEMVMMGASVERTDRRLTAVEGVLTKIAHKLDVFS